jgi:hypothetical protein
MDNHRKLPKNLALSICFMIIGLGITGMLPLNVWTYILFVLCMIISVVDW